MGACVSHDNNQVRQRGARGTRGTHVKQPSNLLEGRAPGGGGRALDGALDDPGAAVDALRLAGPLLLSLHIGINRLDPSVFPDLEVLSSCVRDAEDMEALAKANRFTTKVRGSGRTQHNMACSGWRNKQTKAPVTMGKRCTGSHTHTCAPVCAGAQVFTDGKATLEAVRTFIFTTAASLQRGDMFLLTFSGHGSSVIDLDGDERDGRDEAWCLHNGLLLDDELHALLCQFAAGVRVVIVSDSCHSGSMIDQPDTEVRKFRAASVETKTSSPSASHASSAHPHHARDASPPRPPARALSVAEGLAARKAAAARERQRLGRPKAAVVLLAGCQDSQKSGEGDRNGAFTAALREEYERLPAEGATYKLLLPESVRERAQVPS